MNKFTLSIILFLFAGSVNVFSQSSISWQKTVGGSGHEYARKTILTSDGGYAFVGDSESNNGDVTGNHGGSDLWVGKLNSAGIIQWSYLFGGTADDVGYDILQTSDGGYMVAGWTDSNDGDVSGNHSTYSSDVWVLKLSPAGAITWSKCYGGSSDDDGAAIVQTQDGNFYIAGSTYSTDGDVIGNHGTYSDFWVIKINASGTLTGQKCIGGTDYEEGINMTLTSDNGCIVCGRTSSNDGDAIGYHDGSDMLIAKLSSSLSVDWSKCYGGTETEECNSVVQLSDGSYAALGYTSTQNNGDITGHHGSQGSDDFWLLKLTSAGAITWAKCFGGSGDDQANGLTKTSDGGFVMCGLTNSMDGNVSGFHVGDYSPDVWVIKVNSSGVFQWQRCCGGSTQDESFNVFESGSGTFVVTAFTYSNDYDVSGNHGNADGWIFRISGNSSIGSISDDQHISIYPNPAQDNLTIEVPVNSNIAIINTVGQNMINVISTSPKTMIDLSELTSGVYIIAIRSNEETCIKKLVRK
jgi:hypothetical protein